jgi:hypothetical protein
MGPEAKGCERQPRGLFEWGHGEATLTSLLARSFDMKQNGA